MTQTLTKPATIDVPIELVEMPACPSFCEGNCDTWNDEEGSGHHTSGFATVTIAGGHLGEDVDLDVSASRSDDDYQAGAPEVNLLPSRGGEGVTMTPAEARELAALLLEAADDADRASLPVESGCPAWCRWHPEVDFPGPRIHIYDNVTVFTPPDDHELSLSLDEEQGTPRVWLDSNSFCLIEAKSIGEQLIRLAKVGGAR